MHVRAADGTPMADAMLAILQGLGVEIDRFGDSAAVDGSQQRGRRADGGGVMAGLSHPARC